MVKILENTLVFTRHVRDLKSLSGMLKVII